MFVDEGTIYVRAGDGGNGVVSFRREKSVAFGGPDGGDGGDGGDVVFIATPGISTLFHLIQRYHFRGERGEDGWGRQCCGKDGQDCIIKVPVGTIIRDATHGLVLKDMSVAEERFVVAAGGNGGFGNKHFATALCQTPRRANKGQQGEERKLHLELKLIADIGLVGLPNAGKSTLVSRVSAARPKIADYPFTTLHPFLGIVRGSDYRSLVMADLPGLIEGAHEGKGLGDRFLRHIERTRITLHLIDAAPLSGPTPAEAYRTIRAELAAYSPALASKREIVVANKLDLPEAEANIVELEKTCGKPVMRISAVTGQGIPELLQLLFQVLQEEPQAPPSPPEPTVQPEAAPGIEA